jgi:phosphatidylserine/phosphatidylglycerophosphate/cardiolipin synthase-like enzyme
MPMMLGAEKSVSLLMHESLSPLTIGNSVKLLINGEEKFPEVLEALQHAKHHIHLEYYIFEDDEVGNRIKDMLIRKAQEGIKVRFIYDDFGSSAIRRKLVELRSWCGSVSTSWSVCLFCKQDNYGTTTDHNRGWLGLPAASISATIY